MRTAVRDDLKHEENCYGFVIFGYDDAHYIYLESEELQKEWLSYLQPLMICAGISFDYNLKDQFNRGTNSRIMNCISKDDENVTYAVKAIEKTEYYDNERYMKNLINEIESMRVLKRPNLVNLHRVYEDKNYVFLVIDLCG